MNMKLSGRYGYYIFFGGVFFLFWCLFKVGGMQDISRALLSTAIDVAVTMAVMIVTVEGLLPRLLYAKKGGLFVACFLSLVVIGGSVIILSQLRLMGSSLSHYRENIARYPGHYYYWFWADLVFGSYFLVFFIPATGAAIRLAFDRIRALNLVEKLQKEKALSELELLKHQINPHFLFNALNTIYYKIDRGNPSARETLERFSSMLRYQLYECDAPFVEVEKELSFLLSYVHLQRERLNDNYTITCWGLEEVKGFSISPFLLMPLVENCFKHVSSDPERGNYISIECRAKGNSFFFRTGNTHITTASERPDKKAGIGLENVKKRLDLLYPGRHELIMKERPGYYETTLTVQC
jgi:two-component system LytT family sensor kinase